MTRPTCKTCRHWGMVSHAALPEGVPEPGMCHIRSVQQFPIRNADDWCGEHKPAPPVSKKINTNNAWFKTHDEVPAGGTRALYMDAECTNSHGFPIVQDADGTWPDMYIRLQTEEPGYAEYEEPQT